MKIFWTFKSEARTRRFVLVAALAAAITALPAVATPANAEPADGIAAAPLAAAESAVAVSPAPLESLPPVEQAEMPVTGAAPEPAAPEPVETKEITSAADSAARAVEDDVVAVAQSNLSASIKPINSAVPSQKTVAGSVPDVANEVGALTKTAPVASGAQQLVSGLAEHVRQDSAKTIEGIRQGSAKTIAFATDPIASVTDRLPAIRALPELPELLDSAAPATVAALLPAAGATPETAGKAETGGVPSFPEPPWAGLLSHLNAIALDVSVRDYLVQPGEVGTVGLGALNRSGSVGGALFPALGAAGPALAGIAVNRFRSPAPVDVPLPEPGSPATTVPGSGGSFFVPLAALLALLALVVPATLRRFWEAPDFRAPTPFVCALERPG